MPGAVARRDSAQDAEMGDCSEFKATQWGPVSGAEQDNKGWHD